MNLPTGSLVRLEAALIAKSRREGENLLITDFVPPLPPTAAKNVALLLKSHGWHRESLPYFQSAISGASPEVDSELWRIAEGAVKKSTRSSRKREDFWRGCNSAIEVSFEEARKHILEGSAEKAILALNSHVGSLYSPSQIDDIFWCLEQLATMGEPRGEKRDISKPPIIRPYPVFAAGTGWSGSGAVYDYLSECEEVLAVAGEVPSFSLSSHSLLHMHQSIVKDTDLKSVLVGFFFENVLGFSLIRHPRHLKAFEYARARSLGPDSANHFAFARDFCELAASLLQSVSKSEKLQQFALLVDAYVSSFAPQTDSPAPQKILFDNAIPLNRLHAFSMMESGTLVGSVRDVRSIYADRLLNDPRFSDSLARFIGVRLFSRLVLSFRLRRFVKKSQGKQSVFVVQFEEFVSNDSLRKKVAEKLRLNPHQHKAGSLFNPAESQENIHFHKTHISPAVNRIMRAVLWSSCISRKETDHGTSVRPHRRLPGQLRPDAGLQG